MVDRPHNHKRNKVAATMAPKIKEPATKLALQLKVKKMVRMAGLKVDPRIALAFPPVNLHQKDMSISPNCRCPRP